MKNVGDRNQCLTVTAFKQNQDQTKFPPHPPEPTTLPPSTTPLSALHHSWRVGYESERQLVVVVPPGASDGPCAASYHLRVGLRSLEVEHAHELLRSAG